MELPWWLSGKEFICKAGKARDMHSTPGSKDPLQKAMAMHSSILAWKIARTREPGGLQSTGLQGVGHA